MQGYKIFSIDMVSLMSPLWQLRQVTNPPISRLEKLAPSKEETGQTQIGQILFWPTEAGILFWLISLVLECSPCITAEFTSLRPTLALSLVNFIPHLLSLRRQLML